MAEIEAVVFKVRYLDDTGRQWSASFLTAEEALDQAAVGVLAYGGVAPQEVVDRSGAVVYDQAAIIARADELAG